MQDSFAAVHAAIATKVATLDYPLFDHVDPSNTAAIYNRMGNDTIADDSTKDGGGDELTVEVHTFTLAPHRGRAKCKQVMGEVFTLLHDQPLAVDGFGAWRIRREFATVIMEENDTVAHGVSRFRINTEPE